MRRYSTVFFDLDGTLTDPAPGITNSILYALDRLGFPAVPRESLYRYIGPPLSDSFRELCGFTNDADARHAVDVYREYFSVTGLFENEVYPGIPPLLEKLRRTGYRLAVATGKPDGFSVRILEHFHLIDYFEFVAGATMDEKRLRKDEVIRWGLENCGITDPANVLMVGDREHDIRGARQCGTGAAGVLYGYGTLEELTAAAPDLIAATPEELGEILMK